MWPCVIHGGLLLADYSPSFGEIWDTFQQLATMVERRVLELLGALLFRMSQMRDHQHLDPPTPTDVRRLTAVSAGRPTGRPAVTPATFPRAIPTSAKWRWRPPENVMAEVRTRLPEGVFTRVGQLPVEVFLQYIDALAWNEDVKYRTITTEKGKSYRLDVGRRNNLSTSAHVIAVMLTSAPISGLGQAFSRGRGVGPIQPAMARQAFPDLQ
jgi:hypothetical protein